MTARLVSQNEGGTNIVLDKAITLIGRHPDCDAVLEENQKISRRHCCIAQVDNRLVLRDLGSMNGIRVNGETVTEVDLREGDEITIGDEDFVLQLKSSSGAAKKKASVATVPPTPEKPKKMPKPVAATPPPAPRRNQTPSDLSQEFPVAIPDEFEFEDLRPIERREATPPKGSGKPDPKQQDQKKDKDVFKLDSGILELDELDSL